MSDNRKSNDIFKGSDSTAAIQQHMSRIQEMSGDGPPAIPQEYTDQFTAMMAREFGVQIPNEVVPLPSEGRIYATNHPLHNKTTVDIRAMTARDEDILTSPALLKKGAVITELIRSCLLDKNINPNDLLVGDRNALMVGIRVTGYGSQYPAEVTCSECNVTSETTFDLSALAINSLNISPVASGVNEFDYQLPRSGVVVRFRFLTGRDENEILMTQERQKKTGVGGDNNVTLSLQHHIVSVNGVTDKVKLATFVKMMPAADSTALRAYIRDNEPGIVMKQERTCEKCNHVEEVTIPIGVTFLWPNARK